MLHADVEPEEGWLDKAIEEMEARDLDLLGVVVPIKDLQGLTSIALENHSGSGDWKPSARPSAPEPRNNATQATNHRTHDRICRARLRFHQGQTRRSGAP